MTPLGALGNRVVAAFLRARLGPRPAIVPNDVAIVLRRAGKAGEGGARVHAALEAMRSAPLEEIAACLPADPLRPGPSARSCRPRSSLAWSPTTSTAYPNCCGRWQPGRSHALPMTTAPPRAARPSRRASAGLVPGTNGTARGAIRSRGRGGRQPDDDGEGGEQAPG